MVVRAPKSNPACQVRTPIEMTSPPSLFFLPSYVSSNLDVDYKPCRPTLPHLPMQKGLVEFRHQKATWHSIFPLRTLDLQTEFLRLLNHVLWIYASARRFVYCSKLIIQAEEEAARRYNIGRALVSSQYGAKDTASDLFGKNAIRTQLSAHGKYNPPTWHVP